MREVAAISRPGHFKKQAKTKLHRRHRRQSEAGDGIPSERYSVISDSRLIEFKNYLEEVIGFLFLGKQCKLEQNASRWHASWNQPSKLVVKHFSAYASLANYTGFVGFTVEEVTLDLVGNYFNAVVNDVGIPDSRECIPDGKE